VSVQDAGSRLPLADLRVLDLCRYGPGQLAAMVLGDMGADVVRIDEPWSSLPENRRVAGSGGLTERELPTYAANRNKRSVVVDLKSPEGRDILLALAARSAVVVEGYRPGVADRLKVGYDDVRAVNPDVVYCSVSGYGQTGPYRTRSGHDLNYVSMAGVTGRSRDSDGKPVVAGAQVADFGGGTLHALVGILVALRYRDAGGGGQFVDAAMTDGVFTMMTSTFARHFTGVEDGRTVPVPLTGSAPYYQIYRTVDGRWLSLCCNETQLWRDLCRAIGRDDLEPAHDQPGRWPETIAELQATFATRPMSAWLDVLGDAPVFEVLDLADVPSDPQVRHREVFVDVPTPDGGSVRQVGPMLRLSRTPGAVRRLAPRRGEHTRQVLEELAGALANDLDVADLLARGVVFDAIPDVPDSSLTSK
jgi:crotonobetainyl-CoA:carnitine CoA-transferase CaiB-like acyl-CoA transferase